MPRFVILRHETPPGYERPTHFDLMLEWDGMLRTWALAAFPQGGESIEAEELAPHRREYLEYEGEVTGGRGTISQMAAGRYELIESMTDLVCLELSSSQIVGMLRMTRLSPESARWLAILGP